MSRRRNRSERIANEEFNESAYDNRNGWIQYRDKLCELSMSMFEWKNLPDGIDPMFLERTLFFQGQILFFRDDALDIGDGYIVMPFNGTGTWDIYNVPMTRYAYATNGYQNKLTNENSVIIYNNFLRKPSSLDMKIASKRLWKLDRVIDINTNAQKTPILILCDEKQRLTLENLYMKYDGNQPVIYGNNNSLTGKEITCVQTGAPFIADKLTEIKTQIWNEALTYLGISNVNYQKKERMVTDEVTRNQGGTIANRYSRLEARRQACKQINDMFGLDIWCDFREDFQSVADVENDTIEGEPNSDGEGGEVDE